MIVCYEVDERKSQSKYNFLINSLANYAKIKINFSFIKQTVWLLKITQRVQLIKNRCRNERLSLLRENSSIHITQAIKLLCQYLIKKQFRRVFSREKHSSVELTYSTSSLMFERCELLKILFLWREKGNKNTRTIKIIGHRTLCECFRGKIFWIFFITRAYSIN